MGITQLDLNLLDAWHRIGAKCRADRMEALRRSRRRHQENLINPPRAWTLAIRASDTRIGLHNALYDFPTWHEAPEGDSRPGEQFIRDGETWESALARGVTHSITLDGFTIRDLTKPVEIAWPGVPVLEAARMLGRPRSTVDAWIDARGARGAFLTPSPRSLASGRESLQPRLARLRREGRGVLKLWGYDYPAMHGVMHGLPMPIVYTPSPVDPNHQDGRPPDGVWGTLWTGFWQKLPEEFAQSIERVGIVGRFRGKDVHRGWLWRCPGRLNVNAEHEGCGRTCKTLFAPLPVWTLANAGIEPLTLDMPEDSGLAGQWHPGRHETPIGEGYRSFACAECWKVQNFSLLTYNGWNRFVTYISGGLLYGREVERPMEEAPPVRVRKFRPRRRAAPKREMMLARLAAGRTVSEIAAEFGVTYQTVWQHFKRAMKLRGAADKGELIAMLRAEMSAEMSAKTQAKAQAS